MPDQKTIDRVAVGLADLAIELRYIYGLSAPLVLLLQLLGLSKDVTRPDWAERALEDHYGTPKELVATLRELAGEPKGESE